MTAFPPPRRPAAVPRVFALAAALGVLGGAPPADAQAFKPKKSKIPDAQVDAAISKGIEWLKSNCAGKAPESWHYMTTQELLLYTFHHGGLPKDDPVFQDYLHRVVDADPEKTYRVACAAMCLADLDKVGYAWKLEQYAQFLMDTQCKNGQWSYGEPMTFPKPAVPTAGQRATVESGPAAQPAKPASPPLYGTIVPADAKADAKKGASSTVTRKRLTQRKRGPDEGDNSNSQYAALGLRACVEANFQIDPKCVQDALQWWTSCQNGDGGWGYHNYEKDNASRGSMTVGGVGSVSIYDWMLRISWKSDPKVVKGFQWMNESWTLTDNARAGNWSRSFHYYYLYGLERSGMIVGTDFVGTHDWYDEGAAYLIKSQGADGSWLSPHWGADQRGRPVDTCLAILFLRRATKPLPKIATQ